MTKTRFVSVLLATVIVLVSLAGCGEEPSEEDVLNELKPAKNEKYAIHLFYKNSLPDSEIYALNDAQNKYNNSGTKLTKPIIEVGFWDRELERGREWAKAIGIKDFPMYVIVGAEGIVLETPYLTRVKEFLSEDLMKEQTSR